MTAREAIYRLKVHFAIHNDGYPTPYLDEAVQLAYTALEWYSTLEESAVKINEIPEEYLLAKEEVMRVLGLEE